MKHILFIVLICSYFSVIGHTPFGKKTKNKNPLTTGEDTEQWWGVQQENDYNEESLEHRRKVINLTDKYCTIFNIKQSNKIHIISLFVYKPTIEPQEIFNFLIEKKVGNIEHIKELTNIRFEGWSELLQLKREMDSCKELIQKNNTNK
jgi:hypothetical protein